MEALMAGSRDNIKARDLKAFPTRAAAARLRVVFEDEVLTERLRDKIDR
eukprot:XP_001707907.1 Hypothetical protein GL50803_8970 [Giardia lamblia ATCC 50803]